MPKFSITDTETGKRVTVSGDSAPTHDEAEQIFRDAGLRQQPDANPIVDAFRSIPGGLAKGDAAIAGGVGDLSDMMASGMKYLGIPTRERTDPVPANYSGPPIPADTAEVSGDISKPFGGYYVPKTTTGRVAETAASFWPAAIGGEATIPQRVMGRMVAPAAGSMAAGSAFDPNTSPFLHGAAQVGGALAGGGIAAGSRALGGALLNDVPAGIAANQYLARALQEQKIAPQSITDNSISGKGQLAAEAIGPNGVSTLATLGRRQGDTGKALADILTARSVGAPSRVMDDFTSAAGIDPRAARGDFEGVLTSGQKRATPLYEEAYKQNQNISSPTLDKILDTPAGKKALADARVKMQNDMSLMGTPDAELMDQAKEGGTVVPPRGVASGMKLRVYDYVKRSLDDQISTAYRAGNKNEGNILVDLKGKLVKALDDADITAKAGPNSTKPEGGMYAQARAAASDYLGAKQAFEDGQDHILSTSVDPVDVEKYVSKLSPTALEAYKGGQANKLLLQAGNARLSPRLLNTPAVQQKLSASLGPDKAQQFITNVQNEAELARTGARMMPGTGSITSDIGLMSGEQDAGANIEAGMKGAKALGHALQGNPLGAVSNGISALRHFAPDLLKTGGLSSDARNELGKLLMMKPEDLASHVQMMPVTVAKKPSLIGKYLLGGN